MPNDYLGFLDQQAARRRLLANFSQPRLLLLHTIAFVGVVTALWAVIIPLLRWVPLSLFNLPALTFFVWSIVLAAHALLHYRRSSAVAETRELAVEAEMRQLITQNPAAVDDDALFALHTTLGSDLERDGWLSQGLTVFALVNAVSWFGASLNLGTSWGYTLTLPAALVLIGGIYSFRAWQHSRKNGDGGVVTRLPLHHIVVYAVGMVLLGIMGSARMINSWDIDNLVGGWTIALLLHILWSVVGAPLFRRASLAHEAHTAPAKRKNTARLALTDDGEILSTSETDATETSSAKHRPAYRS